MPPGCTLSTLTGCTLKVEGVLPMRRLACANQPREYLLVSKLMTDSAYLCLGIVRDAFGNGFAGDAERSLRYLVLAARGLELHIEMLQNRNDPRVESKVRAFHRGLNPGPDAFPP